MTAAVGPPVEIAVQWRQGDKWSKVHRVYLGKAICGARVAPGRRLVPGGPRVTRVTEAGLDAASFYGGLCSNCYVTPR